jgi:hypothetical protein
MIAVFHGQSKGRLRFMVRQLRELTRVHPHMTRDTRRAQIIVERSITIRKEDAYALVHISIGYGLTAFTVIMDKEVGKYRDATAHAACPSRARVSPKSGADSDTGIGGKEGSLNRDRDRGGDYSGGSTTTAEVEAETRDTDAVDVLLEGLRLVQTGFEAADVPCCMQVRCRPAFMSSTS